MAILVMDFKVCGFKNSTTFYHHNEFVQKNLQYLLKWNVVDLSKNGIFLFLNSELLIRNQG